MSCSRRRLPISCGWPNISLVDLNSVVPDRQLARVIARGYAKRHTLVPLSQEGRSLTVALADPNAAVVEDLARLTGLIVVPVAAPRKDIERAFTRLYDAPAEPPAARPADDESASRRGDEVLRAVLLQAIDTRTTDVHLEMFAEELRVRFRVDGVLRRPSLGALQAALDRNMREVISRVKILSRLDIAERRRPQDGSFQMAVDRNGRSVTIDLRVSIVPSHSGESVVIRILDRARAPRALADLDLAPDVLRALEDVLRRTSGIFLVSGPTGAGKTTTLYSCLMRLHRPEIRILTAEDPVEYVYDGLSQCEVNDDIGNTFAAYLRAFLRHDPEVILVGEIRDEATAEMAFRAAQTGHLLLSTLHTNTALAAWPRLVDLGVESSLIASCLAGVLSQRLARTVCAACARPCETPADEASAFFSVVPEGFVFVRGSGCTECGFTGYRGRMVIADLWVPDEQDLRLIARQAPFDEVRRSASRTTFSMAQDAHARLKAGRTTVEELARVLPYAAIAEHRERFSCRNISA